MKEKPQRTFPVVGNGDYLRPNYTRVVRCLDDDELRAELDAGRGDGDYRSAAVAELKRREENR